MSPSPVTVVEAKEMFDRGDPIVFVDSRNPTAWEQSGHKLPGAVRVPVDDVAQHLKDLPAGATAITYCT